jgi:hypothetical protein
MATTGKASKEQVKKQVNKAGAQIARQMQSQSQTSAGGRRRKGGNAAGNNNNGRPASAPAAIPAGLKISFKPAELNKTTEKSVALQVRCYWLLLACGSGGCCLCLDTSHCL